MFHRMILLAGLATTAAVAISCGNSSPAPAIVNATNLDTVSFASSLNVHLSAMTKINDGLYYQDSVVGTGGTAARGSSITANYTGWLTNGVSFQSGGFTNPTALGVGAFIVGWDEGLIGMKVGGWRKLVISPALGYGNGANGSIPANSVLIFNVQLTSVQ